MTFPINPLRRESIERIAYPNKEAVVVKFNPYNYTAIGIIHKSLIESQIRYIICHRRFRVCGRRIRASPWQCRD